MRRDADGVLTDCPASGVSLMRAQLAEAGDMCRSEELASTLRGCLPSGYPARLLEPTAELPPELVGPFTVEQPGFTGESGAWHPTSIPFLVRADGGKVTSYFSESSYWPALLTGAGGLLGPARAEEESRPSRQVVYGLHPCARPETATSRLRRMAFTQAHIDVFAAAASSVMLGRDALLAARSLVRQITGHAAGSVRARVSDSRAWTGLLAPYASPRLVQKLRRGFLDPAAAGAALHGADPALLSREVRPALDRAGLAGLPDPVVEVIKYRVRTGRYERDFWGGPAGEPVRALAGLCAEAGIQVVIDARSARIGYSGLTWQIDCRGHDGGWVEVAGGGDYTDAVGLLCWLRTPRIAPVPVRVAGSAVGVERALEVSAKLKATPGPGPFR